MTNELYVDIFTASTYDPEGGEICCPKCGSWTNIDECILEDPFMNIISCPLCRLEEYDETECN